MLLGESSHPSTNQIARVPGIFLEKVGRFVVWRCVIAAHMIDRPSTLPLTTVCIQFNQYAAICQKGCPKEPIKKSSLA
ncbi:hypothetical protein D3C85_1274800 [compost metagenome]